jgi:methionine sulfoxide reductase heme-binding subunit
VLVLIHWIFIHNSLAPALVHFIPLLLLVAARFLRHRRLILKGA